MNRLKQLKTYPFGLFLWLEWILLSANIAFLPFERVIETYVGSTSLGLSNSAISLMCILMLWIIGLQLPTEKKHGWLYLALQIAIVCVPTIFGDETFVSIFSILVIVMRNCLTFDSHDCWLANILLLIFSIPIWSSGEDFAEFQMRNTKLSMMTLEQYQQVNKTLIIGSVVETTLCIVLIWILVNFVLKEHNSQKQLARVRQQLREYALQAEDRATVNERNRIAREIHDSLGHALTAQSIQLNNAIAFWESEPDKAYSFLRESKNLVATALKEIRYSVAALRSDPLQNKSLGKAIASLFQEFSQRTGVTPYYRAADAIAPVAKEVKTTIYRVVQEALTNIAKHSQATQVKVELQTTAEYLRVIVTDNGKGFDPQQNITGMGLQGIRERAIALNGYLVISSQIAKGCTLTVHIPSPYLMSHEEKK